jgi:hypothetical protein
MFDLFRKRPTDSLPPMPSSSSTPDASSGLLSEAERARQFDDAAAAARRGRRPIHDDDQAVEETVGKDVWEAKREADVQLADKDKKLTAENPPSASPEEEAIRQEIDKL